MGIFYGQVMWCRCSRPILGIVIFHIFLLNSTSSLEDQTLKWDWSGLPEMNGFQNSWPKKYLFPTNADQSSTVQAIPGAWRYSDTQTDVREAAYSELRKKSKIWEWVLFRFLFIERFAIVYPIHRGFLFHLPNDSTMVFLLPFGLMKDTIASFIKTPFLIVTVRVVELFPK